MRRGQGFKTVAIFLLAFCALQWTWSGLRGSALERWLIHDLTVASSVRLIAALTPQVQAQAQGATIQSPGGGLAVRNGCEGTELLFLLFAGLAAYPFSWRARIRGLFVGAAAVFVLNQARLLVLFYSARSSGALFEQVHGLIAPLLMVALMLVGFSLLIRWDERATHAARQG